MKTTRLSIASSLMLIAAVFVSCNRHGDEPVYRAGFDVEQFAKAVGTPFAQFVQENDKYIFGTGDGVVTMSGECEVNGAPMHLNIFVTSDYDGNVSKVLAQPVDYSSNGTKLWEHFTSEPAVSSLGDFVKAKYRTYIQGGNGRELDDLGELGSLEALEELLSGDGYDSIFACAIYDCIPGEVIAVPLLDNGTGGILLSASRNVVHYDTAPSIIYSKYESVLNENFITSTVVYEDKIKTVTLDDAVDVLGNPVNFVICGDPDSDEVLNIDVTPVSASTPEAWEEFWKSYVQNADEKLDLGTFSSAKLVSEESDEDLKTAQNAISYLEDNGRPAEGETLTVRYATGEVIYRICLDSERAYLDIRHSSDE